jgi:hypothetical protein
MFINQSLLLQQSTFRKFANIDEWNHPLAITLTMRQAVTIHDDHRVVTDHLTPEKASQNLRHFLNLINRRVFGKAAIRFGKQLRVIPVLEGGNGKRLHYHLAIDCPSSELQGTLPGLIRKLWQDTMWGYGQIDIQPDADAGWIKYISKLRDKPSFADAIDWLNYHNPD